MEFTNILTTDYNNVTDNIYDSHRVVSFKSTLSIYNVKFNKDTYVDFLIIGGGGAGGKSAGGGGGAGGLLYKTNILFTSGDYILNVGVGGTNSSSKGIDSIISQNNGELYYVAYGGGGGESMAAENSVRTSTDNTNGGSGGGGQRLGDFNSHVWKLIPGKLGGTSIIGQGKNGGAGKSGDGRDAGGGGGGGAGEVGTSAYIQQRGGDGGSGLQINITGTNIFYAGGGGGGTGNSTGSFMGEGAGVGGNGGGGNGAKGTSTASLAPNLPFFADYPNDSIKPPGTSGTNGLGGGGGGGSAIDYAYVNNISDGGTGGNGGSGIIIIRYSLISSNLLQSSLFTDFYFKDIPSLFKYRFLLNPTFTGIYRMIFGGQSKNYLFINENANSFPYNYVNDNVNYIGAIKLNIENKTVLTYNYSEEPYFITFPNNVECDIMILAGGGGGAGVAGGGGGAGGLIYAQNVRIPKETQYIIKVGVGGTGGSDGTNENIASYNGNKGGDSSINIAGYIAKGGGGGIAYTTNNKENKDGGSGGGSSYFNKSTPGLGISGQGFNGGNSDYSGFPIFNGGGGGGCGGLGQNAIKTKNGDGGIGRNINITGTATFYGGGGGGGANNLHHDDNNIERGLGGNGGGGNGGITGNYNIGNVGIDGLGGGGGGASLINGSIFVFEQPEGSFYDGDIESSVGVSEGYDELGEEAADMMDVLNAAAAASILPGLEGGRGGNGVVIITIIHPSFPTDSLLSNELDNEVFTNEIDCMLKINTYYPIVIISEDKDLCYLNLQREVIQFDRSKIYIDTPFNIINYSNLSLTNINFFNNKFNDLISSQPYIDGKFGDLINIYTNSYQNNVSMIKLYISLFTSILFVRSISTKIFDFKYTDINSRGTLSLHTAFSADNLIKLQLSEVVNYTIEQGETIRSYSTDYGSIIINLDYIFLGEVSEFNLYINRYVIGAHGISVIALTNATDGNLNGRNINGGNGASGGNGGDCIQLISTNPLTSSKKLNIFTNNKILEGKAAMGGVGGDAGRPAAPIKVGNAASTEVIEFLYDTANSKLIFKRGTPSEPGSGVEYMAILKLESEIKSEELNVTKYTIKWRPDVPLFPLYYYEVDSVVQTFQEIFIYDTQRGGHINSGEMSFAYGVNRVNYIAAVTGYKKQDLIVATDGNPAIVSTIQNITQNVAKITTPIQSANGTDAPRLTTWPTGYVSGVAGTGGTSGIDGNIISAGIIENLTVTVI